MIIVYGIKNCDTIKKTLRWLDEQQQPATLHDYRKDGISTDLLNDMLTHFSPEELINRRGTTWRQLSDQEKATALTSDGFKTIAAEHPALIKRPLVRLNNDQWLLGYADLTSQASF